MRPDRGIVMLLNTVYYAIIIACMVVTAAWIGVLSWAAWQASGLLVEWVGDVF